MSQQEFTVFAYPISLIADEDGRLVVACRDFPELSTDGADTAEAVTNASDAVEVIIRDRLRNGEVVPLPSTRRAGEFVACPEHITAYRTVLSRWVMDVGRGAQGQLARLLGKGETHVRRLLDPDGGASVQSFVDALRAIGYAAAPSLDLTLAGRLLGTPDTERPHAAVTVQESGKAGS
ncbi:type II toxin-antitoxin system HicB family antitoxin [uncultured Maricaulis sp.]|uniref:type II toxin-antitoxin system HicB family antitoxin n=1 Tax=uncultured Maricaulis sp. TaxID=174710 RepID=UPI0030D8C87A